MRLSEFIALLAVAKEVTADAVFYELPFEQTLVTHAAESISGNVSLQECGVQCNEAGGNCSSFEWDAGRCKPIPPPLQVMNITRAPTAERHFVFKPNETATDHCAQELHDQAIQNLTVLSCEPKWTPFTGNGQCYLFISRNWSFSTANDHCRGFGGNLTSVRDSQENEFIQALANGSAVWLGLSGITSATSAVWSDGSPFQYSNWAFIQPSAVRQCGVLIGGPSNSGKWAEDICSALYPSICRKAAVQL